MLSDTSKSIIIIPARMDSKRFSGKPMAMAAGKPLVEWTWLQARETNADYVWVITPDREIGRFCQDKGIPWRPSNENMPTGTARCAEFFSSMSNSEGINVVVNWQVDEPLVDPREVNKLIEVVRRRPESILTLVAPLRTGDDHNPNTVKVVVSRFGDCMWFSRSEIDGYGHCGIYGFSPKTLDTVSRMEQTRLSHAESLEQLTWIENGIKIHATAMGELPLSINSPEDFEKFKQYKENDDET